MTSGIIAAAALATWLYLLLGRGAFWLTRERDDRDLPTASPAPDGAWPTVVAVIPARDEAETIAEAVGSLLAQDYPGRLEVVVADDESRDGTAEVARAAAVARGAADRLTVLCGRPLPRGWTGKLWAVAQGVEHAIRGEPPDYLLLSDADIAYAPDTLRDLVARADAGGLVLTSLMARLRAESPAERAVVPAFIFFFRMLYPFAWVNRPDARTAAAAGGCMLVRPQALAAAGGIKSIRSALIDDCALGRQLKRQGPIWLGLTRRARSLRAYPRLGDLRRMVSRSAYAQLRYSPLLLLLTVAGMGLTFLAGPVAALTAAGLPQACGIAAWALMAASFQPMLRFYGVSPLWGPALPGIAALYTIWTIDSAIQHLRGRGGMWKGRVQADISELR